MPRPLSQAEIASAVRATQEPFRALYESGFFLRPYVEAPNWMRDEPAFDAEYDAKCQAADEWIAEQKQSGRW